MVVSGQDDENELDNENNVDVVIDHSDSINDNDCDYAGNHFNRTIIVVL